MHEKFYIFISKRHSGTVAFVFSNQCTITGVCYDSLRCSWGQSKKVFIDCDLTFCSSSRKTSTPSTLKCFTFSNNKPSLLKSGPFSLLLISDWLELSIANDEEKCYTANNNEPGASFYPRGAVSIGLGKQRHQYLRLPVRGGGQCSVYAHCTQCALQITRYHIICPLLAGHFSSFLPCPWKVWTSVYYQFSHWSINVLVGNFAWCNSEEILSGWTVFVLVVSWNPSMLLYMETKTANWVCVLS